MPSIDQKRDLLMEVTAMSSGLSRISQEDAALRVAEREGYASWAELIDDNEPGTVHSRAPTCSPSVMAARCGVAFHLLKDYGLLVEDGGAWTIRDRRNTMRGAGPTPEAALDSLVRQIRAFTNYKG